MAHQQELILKFDTMVSEERERKEPTNLFEGWSDEKKVSYMRQLEFSLPQYSEAPNLEDKKVPDSVIFDVTDPNKIQKNYVAPIGHYRSWQYVGSDRRFEFGSNKQRTFVTRSMGTFVFYYRYKHFLVGLIIDGQCGWVEGAITRNVRDGHESVLQFPRKGSAPDYIRSARTHTLAYDGNYTKGENIPKIQIGIWQLCKAMEGIGDFVPGVSKSEPDPVQWQILVLYGPEAGRINYIFDQTKMSLSIDHGMHAVIKIPADLEPFVLSYLKLSKCAIDVLDGKSFLHVKGTTPRSLHQVLLAVLILRRKVVYTTHFNLSDAPPMKYKREEPDQGKRGKALTDDQKLEAANAKGTTYQVGKHDGSSIYQTEKWLIDPLKQDERSFPERPELMMVLIWLSRLWGYLSKNGVALSDSSGVQRGLSSKSLNLNVKKNIPVARIRPGNALNVNPKTLTPQEYHRLEMLDLTKGQNVAQQHTASTFIFCPESSTADLWYWEELHQKKDKSPIGGSGFSMRKSGVASRTEDELCYGEPRSRLRVALGTDNGKAPEIMKRRGISRETDRMDARNKKAKLMVAEHEQRHRVYSSTQGSHASTMEETDSSTDLLTNVHLTARNKAMSMHFMKCHPEGTADATLADKQNIEGSTSLPGTSFSSRFFTAMQPTQKGESPLPASCLCN